VSRDGHALSTEIAENLHLQVPVCPLQVDSGQTQSRHSTVFNNLLRVAVKRGGVPHRSLGPPAIARPPLDPPVNGGKLSPVND